MLSDIRRPTSVQAPIFDRHIEGIACGRCSKKGSRGNLASSLRHLNTIIDCANNVMQFCHTEYNFVTQQQQADSDSLCSPHKCILCKPVPLTCRICIHRFCSTAQSLPCKFPFCFRQHGHGFHKRSSLLSHYSFALFLLIKNLLNVG
jgi:hypothetical protein